MATWADVERLTGALPEVTESTSYGNRAWKVAGKLMVWERPLSARDRAALGDDAVDGEVLAVRVTDEGAKAELVSAEPDTCFTIPHLQGYPIVLVRLDEMDAGLLTELVTEAWRARASPKLLRAHGG